MLTPLAFAHQMPNPAYKCLLRQRNEVYKTMVYELIKCSNSNNPTTGALLAPLTSSFGGKWHIKFLVAPRQQMRRPSS